MSRPHEPALSLALALSLPACFSRVPSPPNDRLMLPPDSPEPLRAAPHKLALTWDTSALRARAQEDVLTRAYSACILANIAFLQQGQLQILRNGGVPLLVRLISRREDRKVVLHCVAALQNLTYKNSDCCLELIEQGASHATPVSSGFAPPQRANPLAPLPPRLAAKPSRTGPGRPRQ